MPFPNFHSARLRQPGLFLRIREIGTGEDGAIRFIGGPLKSDPRGGAVIQAIRFERDKYTPAQAREWLKEHDHSPILFEEATGKEDTADRPLIEEGEVLRFDRSSIANVRRLDDGTITGEAVITRAGVFQYRTQSGETRKEFRPPVEVFKADSIASAKMLPITDRHPGQFVTPDNAKSLAIGFTGENVRQDGRLVIAPLKINTKEGISAVNEGRQQLSLGYKCTVEQEVGRFDGEDYTHVQRGISYNHLALVERGRAGNVAALRLDAADAVLEDVDTGRKAGSMPAKIRLDNGIEYDCAEEVRVEFEKTRKERTDAVKERDDLKGKLDAITAERDEVKSQLEEAKKTDHAEEIRKGVKARIELETKAQKVLPKEQIEKLDGMTDAEIKAAAIAAKYPDLDLKEKSAEYVNARFDAIVESAKDGNSTAQKNADTVIGDKSKSRTDADETTRRDEAIKAMHARSRGEEETANAK